MKQTKSTKKNSDSILSNYRCATKLYHQTMGTKYHIHDLIAIVLGVITPFAGMAFPSAVVGLLNSTMKTEWIFLLILGYAVLLKGLSVGSTYMEDLQYTNYFMRRIVSHGSMREHIFDMDYEALEKKEGQEKLHAANQCFYYGNDYGIEEFLRQFPILSMNLIGFVLYSVIVYRISLWVFLYMLVTAAILGCMNLWLGNYMEKNKKQQADLFMKRASAFKETMDSKGRGDMILYQMKDWLMRKLSLIRNEFRRFYRGDFQNQRIANIVTLCLNLLRDAIVYTLLIHQMIKGQVTVSELLLYTGAIAGYSIWMNQMLKALQSMIINSHTISRYRRFMEYGSTKENDHCVEVPQKRTHEIRLEDVSYRYDGTKQEVLSHVNLTIHEGEKIALVGTNGAGKTTLVKLITGLYQPTQGKIYLDGIDISKFSKEDYYQVFSVVFQDTSVYACSITQNISCNMHSDREKVMKCLTSAGLSEKIASLSQGIDTMMTKALSADGIELSGGEIQKLMLARALYKDAPVLILDEPTAALDPIAESNMYEKYAQFTDGKSSIFISHRLSSTRFCDQVCFLSNGLITEQGTHEQLINLKGEYANMYAMQAKYYQEQEDAREVCYEG